MNDHSEVPETPVNPVLPKNPEISVTPVAHASPVVSVPRGQRSAPRPPAPRFGRGPGSLPIVYPANSRHVGEASVSDSSAHLPAGGVPVRRAARAGDVVGLSRRTREARVRARGFTVLVVSCAVSVAGLGALVWVLLVG